MTIGMCFGLADGVGVGEGVMKGAVVGMGGRVRGPMPLSPPPSPPVEAAGEGREGESSSRLKNLGLLLLSEAIREAAELLGPRRPAACTLLNFGDRGLLQGAASGLETLVALAAG